MSYILKSDRCDNSYYNDKKQRIINFLNESDVPLFPWEIAQKLSLNRSTVRCYLRALAEKGDVVCASGGRYCSIVTYGVMNPPLLHNLWFKIESPWLRNMAKIEDDDEWYEKLHLRIQYGKERGQITGFIAYDRGLNAPNILLLVRRLYELVEGKTGHKVERLTFTTEEWHRDHVGVRIDNKFGLRSFTLEELEGFLTRIYQKNENTVRVENKVSKEMSLDELLEIHQGRSIGIVRDAEIVNKIVTTQERTIDIIRYLNGKINNVENSQVEITKNQKILFEKIDKMLSGIERLISVNIALNGSIQELMRPLTDLMSITNEEREEYRKMVKPAWYS
jgi:hypothetical protein